MKNNKGSKQQAKKPYGKGKVHGSKPNFKHNDNKPRAKYKRDKQIPKDVESKRFEKPVKERQSKEVARKDVNQKKATNLRVYRGKCLIGGKRVYFTVEATDRVNAWHVAARDMKKQQIEILEFVMPLSRGLNTMRSASRKVLNMHNTMLLESKDGINFNTGNPEHCIVSPNGLDGIVGIALMEEKMLVQVLNKKNRIDLYVLPSTDAVKKLTYVKK